MTKIAWLLALAASGANASGATPGQTVNAFHAALNAGWLIVHQHWSSRKAK